jgi:hypothetical protein
MNVDELIGKDNETRNYSLIDNGEGRKQKATIEKNRH